MQLARLETQGFKSFAEKTTLEFLHQNDAGANASGASGIKFKKTMTAIVGPNGSGKSNVSDVIRWVLGEQSMKILRGKKSEDVIFAGSDKKGRLGMAEATLYIDNSDIAYGIELSEIVITRRVYRSGESEYYLNGKPVRLMDVALLLAKAHFGQRTYSVIGQGMIDHVLVASAAERKEFFDEAAGVKEFQIKRHQSMLKIEQTETNLKEAQTILAELEPRVRSLKRQLSRLEERDGVEARLKELQIAYYSEVWAAIQKEYKKEQKDFFAIETELKNAQGVFDSFSKKMEEMKNAGEEDETVFEFQKEYERIVKEQNKNREDAARLKSEIEIARIRRETQTLTAPMSLSEIIAGIKYVKDAQEELTNQLERAKTMQEVRQALKNFREARERMAKFLERLETPARKAEFREDPRISASILEIEKAEVILKERLIEISRRINERAKEEKEKRGEFFELQEKLQNQQGIINSLHGKLGDLRVKLAKLDARREQIEEEMARELPGRMKEIQSVQIQQTESSEETLGAINGLKRKLESIGSIDPETVKEYNEINERYVFLSSQVADLTKALQDLYKIVDELDQKMKARRDLALKEINREFERYFKILFGGGKAELIPIFLEPKAIADIEEVEDEFGENEERKIKPDSKEAKIFAGVEIRAVPPGKRINSINTLSGGERALVSIALICAIINTNPSPFVVLDEVDAALDEFNSIRFAQILKELSAKTQVIAITHNRATMHEADILYGITMRPDGISQVYSLRMDEAVKETLKI